MIIDILDRTPAGFEEILNLIIKAKPSSKKKSIDNYELDTSVLLYTEKLCVNYGSDDVPDFRDLLYGALNYLEDLGVINDFKKKPPVHDLFFDDPEFLLASAGPNCSTMQTALYIDNHGPYNIECDKEKVILFRDIIFRQKKYLCGIGMIKFLLTRTHRTDIESFLDYMEIEDRYKFQDIEILIYAIASSKRICLAKMYHYFGRHFTSEEDVAFELEMMLEKEVVLENVDFKYPNHFKQQYYFNSSLDDKIIREPKDIIGKGDGSVSYDFNLHLLKVGNSHSAFKSTEKQQSLLEYLLVNNGRHVISEELVGMGISDMKVTLGDIRRKLKKDGVSKIQVKQLFNYFEDDGIKYCRILL